MIRLINQLLDRILAHLSDRLERRIQEEKLRIQREQAEIDYLEDYLKRLCQADHADLN